jgi:hypothetical protein
MTGSITQMKSGLKSTNRSLTGTGVFLVAVLAVHVFTHIPQSSRVEPERWTINENQKAKIETLGPNQLLSIRVNGAGSIAVNAKKARLIEPSPQQIGTPDDTVPDFVPSTAGNELRLRVANDTTGSTTLNMNVKSRSDERSLVEFFPFDSPNGETGFQLAVVHGILEVTADWSAAPSAASDSGIYMLGSSGQLQIARSHVEIPAGGALFVRLSPGSKIAATIGDWEDMDNHGLLVASVTLGSRNAVDSSDVLAACGAKSAGVLSRPVVRGDISLGNCQPTLVLSGLKITDHIELGVSGVAFQKREGAIVYWMPLKSFASNAVLQGLLSAIVAAVVAGFAFPWKRT